jgi:hypothetical protein
MFDPKSKDKDQSDIGTDEETKIPSKPTEDIPNMEDAYKENGTVDDDKGKGTGKASYKPRQSKPGKTGSGKFPPKPPKSDPIPSVKASSASTIIQGSGAKFETGVVPGTSVPTSFDGLEVATFGGTPMGVSGDHTRVPYSDEASRSDSRLGKKFDKPNMLINSIISEQVTVNYKESAPLSKSGDSPQGFNGTYYSQMNRRSKISGAVPADPNYERSFDGIEKDKLYFSSGQLLTDRSAFVGYPSTLDAGIGNWLHSEMNVTFDANGVVTDLNFGTAARNSAPVSLGGVSVSDDVLQTASQVYPILGNMTELDRIKLVELAGDESKEGWCPLGRAISNPSATLRLMRDIKATDSAEILMAYRKTAHCLAFQNNKAAKDGQHARRPMREMLLGGISKRQSSSDFATGGAYGDAFASAPLNNGSASLMLLLFDSLNKYNTKADVLLQRRSLKMHVDNAFKTFNELEADSHFLNNINFHEAFSTIDHEYDPLLPVVITDKAAMIHPVNFNALLTIVDGDITSTTPSYSFSDFRNQYTLNIEDPLVYGIYDFLSDMGTKIVSKLGVTKELHIPMFHSTEFFSMWSLLILAAAKYIRKRQISTFVDIDNFEKYHKTRMFSSLQQVSLKDAVHAKNFTFQNTDSPLKTGVLGVAQSIEWMMPELFAKVYEGTDTTKYLLPWYFNEEQFERLSNNTHVAMKAGEERNVMSMPTIREGVTFSLFEKLYDLGERDLRLSLDRMVTPPLLSDDSSIAIAKVKAYKYGKSTNGGVAIEYTDDELTWLAYLSTPRELGFEIDAPAGLMTKCWDNVNDDTTSVFTDSDVSLSDAFSPYSGHRLLMYHASGAPYYEEDATGNSLLSTPYGQNSYRNAAYSQDWEVFHAVPTESKDDGGNVLDDNDAYILPYMLGVSLSINDCIYRPFGALDDEERYEVRANARYIPYFGYDASETIATGWDNTIVSFQRYMWTRLQRLPYVLNPFDACGFLDATGDSATFVDPFDLMYALGYAGNRASDYNEDVELRMRKKDDEGRFYIEDRFVKDSSIFKG